MIQISTSQPTQTATNKGTINPATKKSAKPISISISSLLNQRKDEKDIKKNEVQNLQYDDLVESYTSGAFEKAWKDYAHTVPELVSVISYINSTLPQKIQDHTYEIIFSNVFQENEFKKLLSDLSSYLRSTLKNSSINFVTKVVENLVKDTNRHPEEIFKKMTEQNPALLTLKKNLNLEID